MLRHMHLVRILSPCLSELKEDIKVSLLYLRMVCFIKVRHYVLQKEKTESSGSGKHILLECMDTLE